MNSLSDHLESSSASHVVDKDGLKTKRISAEEWSLMSGFESKESWDPFGTSLPKMNDNEHNNKSAAQHQQQRDSTTKELRKTNTTKLEDHVERCPTSTSRLHEPSVVSSSSSSSTEQEVLKKRRKDFSAVVESIEESTNEDDALDANGFLLKGSLTNTTNFQTKQQQQQQHLDHSEPLKEKTKTAKSTRSRQRRNSIQNSINNFVESDEQSETQSLSIDDVFQSNIEKRRKGSMDMSSSSNPIERDSSRGATNDIDITKTPTNAKRTSSSARGASSSSSRNKLLQGLEKQRDVVMNKNKHSRTTKSENVENQKDSLYSPSARHKRHSTRRKIVASSSSSPKPTPHRRSRRASSEDSLGRDVGDNDRDGAKTTTSTSTTTTTKSKNLEKSLNRQSHNDKSGTTTPRRDKSRPKNRRQSSQTHLLRGSTHDDQSSSSSLLLDKHPSFRRRRNRRLADLQLSLHDSSSNLDASIGDLSHNISRRTSSRRLAHRMESEASLMTENSSHKFDSTNNNEASPKLQEQQSRPARNRRRSLDVTSNYIDSQMSLTSNEKRTTLSASYHDSPHKTPLTPTARSSPRSSRRRSQERTPTSSTARGNRDCYNRSRSSSVSSLDDKKQHSSDHNNGLAASPAQTGRYPSHDAPMHDSFNSSIELQPPPPPPPPEGMDVDDDIRDVDGDEAMTTPSTRRKIHNNRSTNVSSKSSRSRKPPLGSPDLTHRKSRNHYNNHNDKMGRSLSLPKLYNDQLTTTPTEEK